VQLFSENLPSRWRKIDQLVQTSHEQSIQSQQCQIQEITAARLDTQQTSLASAGVEEVTNSSSMKLLAMVKFVRESVP
jgi:hypothetical protein